VGWGVGVVVGVVVLTRRSGGDLPMGREGGIGSE